MASAPAASLPVVDISPFLGASAASRPATVSALRTALLDHGFFYLTGYAEADASSIAAVLDLARTFFQTAPAAEKSAIKRRPAGDAWGDGARGYQTVGENVTEGARDWHEALDWYAPVAEGEGAEAAELARAPTDGHGRAPPYTLLQGINPWPSTPPGFRAAFEAHVARMRELGGAVLRAMGEALDLADPLTFARAAEQSFWVMRAIGYPPLEPGAAGTSCGAHTDYGCLTLLAADATPGALQVWEREEGRWRDVPPRPGALVVNVGDMVERWTGGWVRSTRHRVVHAGAGFRVSVPFFLEPGADVVVRALPECAARAKEEGRFLEGSDEGLRYWDHLVGKVGGNFYEG
jgi:isopenicillin N synthase-like dioxygenase